MRKVGITQTATGAWSASSTVRTSLEREGLITRVELTFELTPSATLGGISATGGVYRSLLNHRLLAGGHTFMDWPSTGESGNAGVLAHYLNNEDFGGMPAFPDQQSIAAPDHVYHPVTWILHMGSRPRDIYGRDNPYDLSGVVPAFNVTDLVAEAITGLNSLVDNAVTIDSGTFRYTIYYVIGTHAEIVEEMVRQGVRLPSDVPGATAMIPAWVAETFAIDTTYSDYGLTRNIPVGRYMKRISVLSQNADATRALVANDQVTGLKISVKLQDSLKLFGDALASKMRKGNFYIIDDAVEMGAGGHPKGILIADLRTLGHPDYGLNFMQGEAAQVGAPKLGLTVTTQASGDDALFLYEGYIPYFDRLGS